MVHCQGLVPYEATYLLDSIINQGMILVNLIVIKINFIKSFQQATPLPQIILHQEREHQLTFIDQESP